MLDAAQQFRVTKLGILFMIALENCGIEKMYEIEQEIKALRGFYFFLAAIILIAQVRQNYSI